MASGPVALFGFKSLISVSISLAVQRIVDNEFSHLLSHQSRDLPIITERSGNKHLPVLIPQFIW